MAKMGFAAPNTHFGASSSFPHYLWLCRSRTHCYSFSTYSSRVFCRLPDDVSRSAKGHVSSTNGNADVVHLRQNSTYATFPDKETETLRLQEINIGYPHLKSSRYNENLNCRVRNDGNKVRDGMLHRGRIAEDWKRATEEFKKKKRSSNNVIGENAEAYAAKQPVGEGQGVVLNNQNRNDGMLHRGRIAEDWIRATEEFKRKKRSSNNVIGENAEAYAAKQPVGEGQGVVLNNQNRNDPVLAFQTGTDTLPYRKIVCNKIAEESPPFSQYSTDVFLRPPSDVPRSAEGSVSNINLDTDSAHWSRRSNHNTRQQGSNAKVDYREGFNGVPIPPKAAEDWRKATEDFKRKKNSEPNSAKANWKQSAEANVAEKISNEGRGGNKTLESKEVSNGMSNPGEAADDHKKKTISNAKRNSARASSKKSAKAPIPEKTMNEAQVATWNIAVDSPSTPEAAEDHKTEMTSTNAKRISARASTKKSARALILEKTTNEAQVATSNIAVESPSTSESVYSVRSSDHAFDVDGAAGSTNGLAVSIPETVAEDMTSPVDAELRERLSQVYGRVLVVDSIAAAKEVVSLLTGKYRNLIHACDTEVANIEVKEETPVDHGEMICFSIYSGRDADYGNGKSCIWVDVLDGGGDDLLKEFAPFFEDQSIKKVWHNYSFDNHVIENYGIRLSGFHADTMHMARLWNSARRMDGGYSLEALTGDPAVMSDSKSGFDGCVAGKISMKKIFGRKKIKKDGSEGKLVAIPPVLDLQRNERELWICYSALDSISTLKLYESLEKKLRKQPWSVDGNYRACMFRFYEEYLRPFGELLVEMETEGMLVDREYLAEIEKVAESEQKIASERFRKWASKYCPDAKYMNVGSDMQLRQFFFGGLQNSKNYNEFLPLEKDFRVPNVDNITEEGRKSPSKLLKITLRKPDGVDISTDKYTATGWPSVGGDVLKTLSGKASADFVFVEDDPSSDEAAAAAGSSSGSSSSSSSTVLQEVVDFDGSGYGTAYEAFGGGQKGIEACRAIAALCESSSIDSLLSNFILPLQGHHISGKNGRIHCSLNINTETGRLSARRPNLQNQPALEKDRYKIRQAFVAAKGNSLIVADYGQLELRILAHLANCKSMLEAFEAGGDFHSRTAMNMYSHIHDAVERKKVLLEWHPQPGEDKPPVPLLKDAFASERRKAKMLNFSIAYGKTTVGLARDWKVSREEARETVNRWYSDRQEVLRWQQERKAEARASGRVHTLLGRARHFPSLKNASLAHKNHIERAAINTPVQGSAADVAMCAMLEISKNARLRELGWKLILQVHDEVILEGPTESAEEAKTIVVDCMSKPFNGENFLRVDLSVDAKCARNWYSAK